MRFYNAHQRGHADTKYGYMCMSYTEKYLLSIYIRFYHIYGITSCHKYWYNYTLPNTWLLARLVVTSSLTTNECWNNVTFLEHTCKTLFKSHMINRILHSVWAMNFIWNGHFREFISYKSSIDKLMYCFHLF